MTSSPSQSVCASTSAVVSAYIGNLRSDCGVKQLENEIQRLFQTIGVSVSDDDVKARRKSKKPAYAFVNLQDKNTFDCVLEKLNGLPSLSQKELIFPGAKLAISLARKTLSNDESKISCITPANSKKLRRHSRKSKHNPGSANMHVKNYQPDTNLVVKGSGCMATSSVTIATSTTTLATSNTTMGANILNSSEFIILDPKKRYYFVGQKLRAEDRLREYKQGRGNYLDLHFKIHLAKYVCAFLNSEGGTLMVGVQDDCTVCGVKISSKKEDLLRLEIDQIMKGFNPPVFTKSYSITFVPVYSSPMMTTKTSNNGMDLVHDTSSVTSANCKTHSENLARNAHPRPVANSSENNANSSDVTHTSSAPINTDNAISNSLDKSNCVSPVYITENNSQDSSGSIMTTSIPITKDNDNSFHLSDVCKSNSISKSPTHDNCEGKEAIGSPSCVPKRLPPLKHAHPNTKHSSSEVLSKGEGSNCEFPDTASCSQKVDHLNNKMMISEELQAIKTDLKVIEVKVHYINGEDSLTLYETNKGEVYIRRDGSIQGPLIASQILAWSRQNINKSHHLERTHLRQEILRKQEEIEMNMKLVNELVQQKQFLEEQYQEKIEKLKENEDKLNAEISLLRSQEAEIQDVNNIQKNRSKVCTII